MIAAMDPRQEERDAAARLRASQKAQRAKDRKAERERRSVLAREIRRTAKTHPHCRCGLRADMSRRELVALGSGCCDRFVCPRLVLVRRAVGL